MSGVLVRKMPTLLHCSMDELLLEASETFEMSQTSPDSCTLLPTAQSSVDLLKLASPGTSSTQVERVK